MSLAPDRTAMFACLERLVAFNTENPPGLEAEAAAFLGDHLNRLGFATELFEPVSSRSISNCRRP